MSNVERFIAPLPSKLPDLPSNPAHLTPQVHECFKAAYVDEKFRRWLVGTNNAEATGGVLKFDHARAVDHIIKIGRERQMEFVGRYSEGAVYKALKRVMKKYGLDPSSRIRIEAKAS